MLHAWPCPGASGRLSTMPPAGDTKASEHLGKTNGVKLRAFMTLDFTFFFYTNGIFIKKYIDFLLQVPG